MSARFMSVALAAMVAVVTTAASPCARADDAAPPAPALAAQPTVRLHIESETPVTLERMDSSPVCEAPCDVDVPLAGSYRIRFSDPAKRSEPFELRGVPGWSRLTLKVANPSRGTNAAGKAFFVVGLALMVGGGLVALAGRGSSSYGAGLGTLLIGGLVGGVGAFSLLIGVALVSSSNSEPAVTQSAAARTTPVRAAWREPDVTERAAPQSFVVPALRFSF